MADFPKQWKHVRDLQPGGQGETFVVQRAEASDSELYVLKRLLNPKRREYFDREILACIALEHPNILKIIEHGETPKGRPFLISEYCDGGSWVAHGSVKDPGAGLRLFRQIVAGIAYAHEHQPPIYHLDLKPENILFRTGNPVVGDFGICFIDDGIETLTKEGQLGSRYYCPPELRGPKIRGETPLAAADIYSLGKVLYWIFTGDVFDGEEDDYGAPESRLALRFSSHPQFAFIDELLDRMVRRKPADRVGTARELLNRVDKVIERIDAGGHVLDLKVPQKCLYCANGHYRPAHEQIHTSGWRGQQTFPDVAQRRIREDGGRPEEGKYAGLREAQRALFYASPHYVPGIPLELICDFCGNVQYFRLDLTADGHGENWRP